MDKVEYKEINRLEAMAIIDSGKTDKLYFVEIYHESKYPYGSYGGVIHYMTPSELNQTSPIKFHSEYIKDTHKLFKRFEKVIAEPGNIIVETPCRKYSHHRWLIMEEELDIIPKPPFLKE